MNPKPIVFALANSTLEIFPDGAYEADDIVVTRTLAFSWNLNNIPIIAQYVDFLLGKGPLTDKDNNYYINGIYADVLSFF